MDRGFPKAKYSSASTAILTEDRVMDLEQKLLAVEQEENAGPLLQQLEIDI